MLLRMPSQLRICRFILVWEVVADLQFQIRVGNRRKREMARWERSAL